MIDADDAMELATGIPREDCPPNSMASKKSASETPVEAPQTPVVQTQTQSGPKYKVRKKTLWKRIKEAFIGDDTKSIPEYLLFDVAIPSVKSLFRESGYAIIDKTFGPGRRGGRDAQRQDSGYLVPYDAPRRSSIVSGSSSAGINFSDYWFQYENDAIEQLSRIQELFANAYEGVTVAQVKVLFRENPKPIDNKWGWMTPKNSCVVRQDGGYIIYMPQPRYLD